MLPLKFNEFRNPFLSDGLMLEMAMKLDKPIWVNNAFYPAFCHWSKRFDESDRLFDGIKRMASKYPGNIIHHRIHSEDYSKKSEIINARDYWISLNSSNEGYYGKYDRVAFKTFRDNLEEFINLSDRKSYSYHGQKLRLTNTDFSELFKGDDFFLYSFIPDNFKSIPIDCSIRINQCMDECDGKFLLKFGITAFNELIHVDALENGSINFVKKDGYIFAKNY